MERDNEVWDAPSSEDQPRDTSDQPESASSELKELGLAIQEGITNLFQLSMIIRKKPEKDEYLKASLTYTIDPTADIVHVGDKYPPVKKKDKWLMGVFLNFNEDGPSYFCHVSLDEEPTKPFLKYTTSKNSEPEFVNHTGDHGYSYIKIIKLKDSHPLVDYDQIQ